MFLELQKLNRATLFHTRSMKSVTAEAKQSMDRLYLSLQNLNYEKMYLQREIAKCKDCESIYQDIELVEDDGSMESLSMTVEERHELMLRKLHAEMAERERLVTQENSLKAAKEELIKETQELQQQLEQLDTDFNTFLLQAVPLQNRLKAPVKEAVKEPVVQDVAVANGDEGVPNDVEMADLKPT
ncbi:THO complex subunit 5 [Irineochytrium annulatum]|nr:THO complex subunit 5 [Irineochytrium annulatum]